MLLYVVVCAVLLVILIGILAYHIVTVRSDEKYIAELEALVKEATIKYEKSVDDYAFLADRYSESLNKHSAAFEDMVSRCKKLEAELDEKNLENIKLQGKIETLKSALEDYDDIVHGLTGE